MQTGMTKRSLSGPLSQPEAEEYLASLQALAQELDRAMQALAANALPSFEDSVSRQQAICARLADAPSRLIMSSANRGSGPVTPDAELSHRIGVATSHLVTLNRRYAALLQHSGDTVRLFANLFRGYTGAGQQGAFTGARCQTWSCEL